LTFQATNLEPFKNMNFASLKPTPVGASIAKIEQVNQFAKDYFKHHQQKVVEYLVRRGLTLENINCFELGWVGNHFQTVARAAGFTSLELLESGFLTKSLNGQSRDRFFQRLMFPIHNLLGEVCGFAGRTLTEAVPKYLNSPETSLFHKSEHLYGIYTAQQAIESSGEVILVEGYLDAILMQQYGFNNTVAIMGSYLSTAQSQLLNTLGVTRAILFFDSDSAGLEATQKSLTKQYPFEVFTTTLQRFNDCAEALSNGDTNAISEALQQKVTAFESRVSSAKTSKALFHIMLEEVEKSKDLQLEVLKYLN
jgi:DNA primase